MQAGIKCAPLFLAFCLIAASLLCGSPAALADNDDFNPNYDFTPSTVGTKGGDINLLLIVENTGTTDITWVGVGIDTLAPYTARWNGSPAIRPGTTRRLSFNVPFMAGDVDETRKMQVTMNNDGDAMSDGSRTFRFKITSVNVFSVSATISPSGPWYPGDTLTVTMRFKNNITTNAATGVVTDAYLSKDELILNNPPEVNQGTIMPGQTKTMTFNYTLRDYDVGRLKVHYKLRGTMLARDYDITNNVLHFDVNERETPTFHAVEPSASTEPESPEPESFDIDFTADLSADPVEIDAGDTVGFRVTVRNTGDSDIGRFEIRNAEGGLELELEGMDSGDDGSVVINKEIYESCDVSFVVIGRTGGDSVSKETNQVHIAMRGEEAASPSASAAQTPEAAPETSISASVEASEAPAQAEAQTISISTEALLIVIAVLLLAILVLVVVLLLRGRKTKQQ